MLSLFCVKPVSNCHMPACLQVRSLVRSTMDGVDKKLEAVAARVRKHLGHGPLFSMVWNTIKNQLLAR
jgi:hypothetical protein